ncbi:PREDICTED: saccharopine dehydrogenase [NAD(+), L-lysine-forming]-like [Acropora digitifera]|uniref:saccharopine dehydrogenase [NAD(+), L-lysine-forming]-like n=1 Tax=Acropora digitifera TaxID=70779 RepID=UPI00077A89A3|nr:PREDICTED: saccharopine dehydrogenase [NAD(+), L-lysine-forming]-like [Acropora digitifera]
MESIHIWLRAETKPNERRRALTPEKCRLLVERGELWLRKFVPLLDYNQSLLWHSLVVHGQHDERESRLLYLEKWLCVAVFLYPCSGVTKSCTRGGLSSKQSVPGVNMVPCGSWVSAPKDAYILGLKELPFCEEPISQKHIFFAHAYKSQTGWEDLLYRFIQGGGSILDIEYMTDENGNRVVAEFSAMAGLCGLGIGILAWCHQQISPDKPMPAIKPYSSEAALIDHIRMELKQVAKFKDISDVFPSIIVIGALGRCGKGAIELAHKVGIPETAIAKWDLDETKHGGPFKEILKYDILANCILLTENISPFVTKDMLELEERLVSWIVSKSSNRPVDVSAIDHLPSVLPCNSSERFANKMTPYLLSLPEDPAWVRTRQMFEGKADEAQKVKEKYLSSVIFRDKQTVGL